MGGEFCSGTYTAGSGCVLDSLTNLGGNCMFRKFTYETLTSTYTAGTQGYASCGSDIGWSQNDYINQPQLYQNYSSWMTTYKDNCVGSSFCPYTTDSAGFQVIPYDGSTDNPAACLQAAALAATDVMFALSYIGSCEYIKSFAYLTAVRSSGACFDLGDGLTYLIGAQGIVGLAYFIVIFVGIWGYRCFESDRNAPPEGAADSEDAIVTGSAAPYVPDDKADDQADVMVPMVIPEDDKAAQIGLTISEVQNPVKSEMPTVQPHEQL